LPKGWTRGDFGCMRSLQRNYSGYKDFGRLFAHRSPRLYRVIRGIEIEEALSFLMKLYFLVWNVKTLYRHLNLQSIMNSSGGYFHQYHSTSVTHRGTWILGYLTDSSIFWKTFLLRSVLHSILVYVVLVQMPQKFIPLGGSDRSDLGNLQSHNGTIIAWVAHCIFEVILDIGVRYKLIHNCITATLVF